MALTPHPEHPKPGKDWAGTFSLLPSRELLQEELKPLHSVISEVFSNLKDPVMLLIKALISILKGREKRQFPLRGLMGSREDLPGFGEFANLKPKLLELFGGARVPYSLRMC